MKTKTKIGKQLERKTNSLLVDTILASKKNPEWKKIAEILSGPRKNYINANLEEINDFAKEGETILVCGKVLSLGEISKKIKVVAVGFSEKAKEKLLKSKVEVSTIVKEIKENPKAENVRVLK